MKIHALLAGLSALAITGGASAAVIAPVSVSSTVAGDAGSSAQWLISDNAGDARLNLQRPVGTAVPLATGASLADALATVHDRDSGGHVESWTSPTGGGNPIFTFDLTGGGDVTVGSIILWQYGNNGNGTPGNDTRAFSLDFRTEAEGTAGAFVADFNAEAAAAGGDPAGNVAQAFGFAGQEDIRYVLLQIDTNYVGEFGGGGDRYGLGEVRFASEVVPEPGSLALLGLGGLALLRRRR